MLRGASNHTAPISRHALVVNLRVGGMSSRSIAGRCGITLLERSAAAVCAGRSTRTLRQHTAPLCSGLKLDGPILKEMTRRNRRVQLHDSSSARAKSVGGTSSPSARAVTRLMTNSNFVGCTTGGQWGLGRALRMRPVYTRRHPPCAKPVVQKRPPSSKKRSLTPYMRRWLQGRRNS
jgi:hypothetical protein